MTRPEAELLLGLLVAAFPGIALEPASEQVYVAAMMKFHDTDTARDMIDALVDNAESFPAIAKMREAYSALRRRRADEAERTNGHYERNPEIDRMIQDLSNRMNVQPDMPGQLKNASPGVCDDCQKQVSARAEYGRFLVCASCARLRLRAAEQVSG